MLAIAVSALACSATGQSPPPPDPASYPALASLINWLRSNAKEARTCSAMVAMTLSARSAYERTKSEIQATDAIARGLVASSKGQLAESRAKALAADYVRTAQQFSALPAEASSLAVAQLCRSAFERGDRPFANPELVARLVGEARACTSSGFAAKAANYVPLECVVTAMSKR